MLTICTKTAFFLQYGSRVDYCLKMVHLGRDLMVKRDLVHRVEIATNFAIISKQLRVLFIDT
jgi:hypothetical protein